MAKLVVTGVKKYFDKKPILSDMGFQVDTGEILGIFGRNGCGKSTLLKIIFGTLKAEKINVQIDGESFRGSEIIKHQMIAYLPQYPFLPHANRVRDLVPKFHPDGVTQDKIFGQPGIERMASKPLKTLSMGERRYLELVLIGHLDHPFLMLDEPYSMVEPLFAEQIDRFLLKLKETKGIILTDHYYKNVWHISDTRKVLKDGDLIDVQSLEELRGLGYLSN